MNKNGAQLAVYALEQIGVRRTFGIPGTHTTEIYDALRRSELITPILTTCESGASFMADATSRTSGSIGCLTIVPAAGLAYALSGMGEAFLAGVPMLVISGGVRRDSGRHYQLHQLDMEPIAGGVSKAQFLVESHADIVPMIYEAYRIATTGEPGPVFLEIPVEILMFSRSVKALPPFDEGLEESRVDTEARRAQLIDRVAQRLLAAEYPMIYVGWGGVDAVEYTVKIAEKLQAPVVLTLQGKSSFPNDHPLYAGTILGKGGLPGSQYALKKQDVMLAVGCRFSEISTASYSLDDPKGLIHIDINPSVFDKNYPAEITVEGDASEVLKALWHRLEYEVVNHANDVLVREVTTRNKKYREGWLTDKRVGRVSPGWFFDALNRAIDPEDYAVLDDGKHTFLAAEHLRVRMPRRFISPTDFNCMGYCIPAAVAVKLAHPDKRVVGIVGDGAAQMTGLELVTAAKYGIAPVIFVFNDGELGQIAQFQEAPLGHKTCTVLGDLNFEGLANAVGAEYLRIDGDFEAKTTVRKALRMSRGRRPVLVEVAIDYRKKTMLTKAVMKANLSRFPTKQKLRFVRRALARKIGL